MSDAVLVLVYTIACMIAGGYVGTSARADDDGSYRALYKPREASAGTTYDDYLSLYPEADRDHFALYDYWPD